MNIQELKAQEARIQQFNKTEQQLKDMTNKEFTKVLILADKIIRNNPKVSWRRTDNSIVR